jgi:dipeptidyl aminopeptidase/acylaminoacyl peptidase
VLLALIFAGEESFGAGASPSPSNAAVVVVTGSPEPSATPSPATPSATEAATPEPTATPVPLPEYGPLEMVYQGRAAALAPIYLLRHDFTVEEEPATMAQDPALDVRRFAWAPDGTLGAGLLADVLVSIEPGAEKRRLGDGIMTITFGRDASTVYAVRVTQDGGNDVANVLAIDFASGDTTELAAISYPRPSIEAEAALEEAQFADDGGAVRLYWMEDEMLRLWALGAGSWTIDPDDGTVEELDDEDVPKLWSPRDEQRVTVGASEGTTTLTLVDEEGDTMASTTIEGRVSHLRWSPDGRAVAFTVGRSASGGGVVQNLFLWDLGDEQPPQQLTNTGAAFGAEWLGSIQRWRP